ncbi:MAG: hypothetical protein ABH873_01660 [Candidatus Firestonebacteria bacterium]
MKYIIFTFLILGFIYADDRICAVDFIEISLARSRLEHQIILEGKIKNKSNNTLEKVSLQLVCLNYDLTVIKESTPYEIKDLSPYFSKNFKIVIKQCPFFNAYKILVKYSAHDFLQEFSYHASDLGSFPQLEAKELIKNDVSLMILSHYLDEKTLNLFVKNEGDLVADETSVLMEFYNKKQNLIKEIIVLLEDGKVKGGEIRGFKVNINPPNYTYYGISLKFSTLEKVLEKIPEVSKELKHEYEDKEYGEFTLDSVVEISKCRFKKLPDGSLEVLGKIRNGKDNPIKNNKIAFYLLDKDNKEIAVKYLNSEEVIKSKEIEDFKINFTFDFKCSNYKYEIKYDEILPKE